VVGLDQPHISDRRYGNFLAADEAGAARQSYGDNYDRLVEVKRTYDASNVFRLNLNIDPTS
jgi:hypothetical protein